MDVFHKRRPGCHTWVELGMTALNKESPQIQPSVIHGRSWLDEGRPRLGHFGSRSTTVDSGSIVGPASVDRPTGSTHVRPVDPGSTDAAHVCYPWIAGRRAWTTSMITSRKVPCLSHDAHTMPLSQERYPAQWSSRADACSCQESFANATHEVNDPELCNASSLQT
jgi:hypothetical protein